MVVYPLSPAEAKLVQVASHVVQAGALAIIVLLVAISIVSMPV